MFKVGDKVRFVNPPLKWTKQEFLGQIAVIANIRSPVEFTIEIPYNGRVTAQIVHISNLELVHKLHFKYVI